MPRIGQLNFAEHMKDKLNPLLPFSLLDLLLLTLSGIIRFMSSIKILDILEISSQHFGQCLASKTRVESDRRLSLSW